MFWRAVPENDQLIIVDVNIVMYLTIASYFVPYMVNISTTSYSYICFLRKKAFYFFCFPP